MRKRPTSGQSLALPGLLRGAVPRRLLVGFLLGCGVLVLGLGAKSLVGSGSKTTSKPAADPIRQVAQEAPPPPDMPVSESPAKGGGWTDRARSETSVSQESVSPMEAGGALVLVLVLLFGVMILVRRGLRRARLAPGRRQILELLDAMPLGQKRHVYVIGLQGRTLVVGTGGDQVSLLAEYGEDEWRPAPPEAAAGEASEPPAPRETAAPRAASGARRAPRQPAPAEEQAPAFAAAPAAGAAAASAAAGRPAARRGRVGQALAAYQQAVSEPAAPADEEAELPAGAHRVPPAFRHLLKRALETEEAP